MTEHTDGPAPGPRADAQEDQHRIIRSAGVVGLAVMGSRLFGLVREQVFATFFGAGLVMDAFTAAFRIPNLLRDLFAEGALSSAFIPTFTEHFENRGKEAAWRLANLILNGLLVVVGTVTLLGIFASPWIVRLIAPGFEEIPGKSELTVLMTRIMFPFLMLVSLAALAMGILNSRNRFGIPASASTFFNIGAIAGGLLFAYLIDPRFGPRAIVGMAVGTLVGGLLQFFVQVPSMVRVGYSYKPTLSYSDPGVRQVLHLMGPAVLATAAVQINVFVNTVFASYLGNGPVSWLNYSFRLMQFPIGVFGVALATVTFPSISRSSVRSDLGEFRETLAGSIGLVFLFCIPSAFGLAFLSRPIIALIYQHGRFDRGDTTETAAALACYSLGLIGYSALKVVVPAFFALNKPKLPMMVSLASIVTNLVFNFLFVRVLLWGHYGLALTTSIVATLNLFFLMIFLRKELGRLNGKKLATSFTRILAASALMTAVAVPTLAGMEALLPAHTLSHRVLSLMTSVLAGAAVFYAACRLFQVEELHRASVAFLGRFRRAK
jgi:putative peptidoglycan lipid II flippase